MLKIQTGFGDPAELDTEDATQEELLILRARAERNSILQESDKYMTTDHPTDKKEEWIIYRESLRDMNFSDPEYLESGDPEDLTWPDKPE